MLKIKKTTAKSGKTYVGLWFDNWLVTIDRRAIYKICPKATIDKLEVGDEICYTVAESEELPL